MKKLLLLLALVGCTTVPTPHGVPNLRAISQDKAIYRSGQITTPTGWNYVRSLGVSNIVKLNLESEGSDAWARTNGFTVLYFPIDTLHQTVLKPPFVLVSNAVYSIKPGTLVHCTHGEDRTGLVSACERVWVEGWKKDAARVEMLDLGFHQALHGLNDFWEDDVK